ncbi:MAG: matrixin family metalloprotease [Acidobacteriota bacterium]
MFGTLSLLACLIVPAAVADERGRDYGLQRLPGNDHTASALPPELAAKARLLKERLLDSLVQQQVPGAPVACFAPGTDPDYIAEVAARTAEITQRLSVQMRDDAPAGRFQLSNRWTTTATDGFGLSQGDPTTMTWSYIPDGTNISGFIGEPPGPSDLQAWLTGIYGNFNTWHQIFVEVFDRWAELTGNTYVYEPNDDGAAFVNSSGQLGVRGDLRIGAHRIDGPFNVLGYNFFPNTGDMVLDSDDTLFNNTSNDSLNLRNTLSHEHGHGLGFNHVCPRNTSKLMEPQLTTAFDGPQEDDILAGQRFYGDPNEPNDTAATATPVLAAGEMLTRGASVSLASIDDNLDADVYSFMAVAGTVDVTLTPTGSSYLNGPQLSNGACSAGTTFNALTVSNLALEVLDTDGTTVLDSIDANGAGDGEMLTGVVLPSAGTYFVRVTGSADNVQRYDLVLNASNICSHLSGDLFNDCFESADTSVWSATQNQ